MDFDEDIIERDFISVPRDQGYCKGCNRRLVHNLDYFLYQGRLYCDKTCIELNGPSLEGVIFLRVFTDDIANDLF